MKRKWLYWVVTREAQIIDSFSKLSDAKLKAMGHRGWMVWKVRKT